MARRQLGTAPSVSTDTATKGYVDGQITTISLTPGPQGASGVPGASGASGVPGASGTPGLTGATGLTGPAGASGGTGGTGGTGAPGASGVPGASGTPGASGAAGPAGPVGATGATGLTGASGVPGASGATGPAGPTTARNISTITTNTTLAGASGTDYVVFANIATITNDPSYSSTLAILHGEGANGSTTITDNSNAASNWTVNGDAKISTAQFKFGSASIYFDGSGDYLTPASSTPYNFGTGDWTVEMWLRPDNVVGFKSLFNWGRSGSLGVTLGNANLAYHVDNTNRITGTTNLQANTWVHVAVCRAGGSTRLFVNGTQEGSTYSDTTNYTSANVRIGNLSTAGYDLAGYLDDIRISNVARYTGNFTAPTAAFPDAGTVSPTVTLPTAVSNTNLYTIKNLNAESLGILRTSNQAIDGSTGAVSLTTNSVGRYVSDGSNWRTL